MTNHWLVKTGRGKLTGNKYLEIGVAKKQGVVYRKNVWLCAGLQGLHSPRRRV